TNQFLNPMLDWLAANPTKRPQYVILFPDFPSNYSYPDQVTNTLYASSSVSLHDSVAFIRPFVTSINMRTTNDCRAYINKLAFFGTNKLVISASAGAYSNTNYIVDNVRAYDYRDNWSTVSSATNGLLAAGV